jgi:triphosphatase
LGTDGAILIEDRRILQDVTFADGACGPAGMISVRHRVDETQTHRHAEGERGDGAGPREIESTLAVCSEEPEEIVRAVAALREIDGFELRPRENEDIRDTYFDTPDGQLDATGVVLRLRAVAGRTLLTIKGPPRAEVHGARSRLELEQEWPDPGWRLLHAELGRHLDLPAAAPAVSDPVEALRTIGLVVVQERRTSRQPRDVVPRAGDGGRVAELAVDSVVFRLAAGEVRHHEVEIEVKAAGGEAALAAVTERLVVRFEPGLRPWPHGKLATGKAVEALGDELRSDDLLTADGMLRPAAYDAIGRFLDRSTAAAT